MTNVEEIKAAITQLSPQAQGELREWYAEFDAQEWDKQIEANVEAGRLDSLAEDAMQAFRMGETTEL